MNISMIKCYETNRGNLSTAVVVNGKLVRVKFISHGGKKGIFSTTDTALQSAIESDPGFGVKFKIKEIENLTKVSEAEVAVTVVDSVTTWQQAKEILRAEPYKVLASEVSSPKKIELVAKRFAISFPNIKR